MKRLALAGLVVVAVGVAAGSALGANGNNLKAVYDSTPANGVGNVPSLGAEAVGFRTLGDKITFAPGPHTRKLNSVVVTMSSWACQQGGDKNDCYTAPNARFSQPITLTIWNESHTTRLASITQTFEIPYRPSVSPECAGTDRPGGWYQASTGKCFNGLAANVAFDMGGLSVPSTVVYKSRMTPATTGRTPSAGPVRTTR